jgi:hypothetical protein
LHTTRLRRREASRKRLEITFPPLPAGTPARGSSYWTDAHLSPSMSSPRSLTALASSKQSIGSCRLPIHLQRRDERLLRDADAAELAHLLLASLLLFEELALAGDVAASRGRHAHAISPRRLASPRPARRYATEMSSSRASQCRPNGETATVSRSAGLACRSGEISKRDAEDAAVREGDPHRVVVEADAFSRNAHAKPFRSRPGATRPSRRGGGGCGRRIHRSRRGGPRARAKRCLSSSAHHMNVDGFARAPFVRVEEEAEAVLTEDSWHGKS